MYTASGNIRKTDLVEEHLPLVRREALYVRMKLPPSVELDDLIQAGTLGLMDAAKRFDSALGVTFATFAKQRVRGAMYDELRRNDWVPRQVREAAKRLDQAIKHLHDRLGRAPEDREVASELGLDAKAYAELLMDSNSSLLLSYDELGIDQVEDGISEHVASPLNDLLEGREKGRIMEAIGKLPEKEQQLLALYYQEEMNLKEIGAVFGVSESRISQLHSQAISRLRAHLKH